MYEDKNFDRMNLFCILLFATKARLIWDKKILSENEQNLIADTKPP
jgi:hypothetical protein